MMVLLFKSQLRADIDAADYLATRARMMDLVHQIPGFVSYKTYTGEDGDAVAIAKFETAEALQAWRTHPEHVAAQRRGRAEFYASYWIQVCSSIREYAWSRAEGDQTLSATIDRR